MAERKYVTVMLVPDGTEARYGFRMREWLLKVIVGAIVLLIIGIVLFFAFYGQVVTRAAMANRLIEENERLMRYQYKVKMLEENLLQTREKVIKLISLAGIDYEFPEIPDDSTLFASIDKKKATEIETGPLGAMEFPNGLPIQGTMSQGFKIDDDEHYHPGIDIACAVGTPVLATANGTVEFVGVDSVYGNMVVIRNNDTITTVYGHNEKILVEPNQLVLAGHRVALSGNTGISTAPHLHYEVRVNDKPVNPLEAFNETNQ